MAEAFVATIERDCVYVNDCRTVDRVLEARPRFQDYNERAPHAALAMRSPLEFRRAEELKLAG